MDKPFGIRIGEVLVQKGWITWDQLEDALKSQSTTNQSLDHVLNKNGLVSKREQHFMSLGEILIRNGWITWDHLIQALGVQRETNQMIGEILMQKNVISKKDLYKGLAIQNHKVFVDFDLISIPPPVLQLVPKHLAYQLRIMPLVEKNHVLLIAIPDAKDVKREMTLKEKMKLYDVQSALACPEDIEKALVRYYGPESR